MKKALITGITGQDGSYLAEYLIKRGYEVHGIVRRSSVDSMVRIGHLDNIHVYDGDLLDAMSISRVVKDVVPDELYNLAALSDVKISFQVPANAVEIGTVGVVNVLEAVRQHHPECKVYQACSSEMFGNSPPPQSETTPFDPQSPYGCGKVFSYHICRNYREAYNMFVSNGILFNHESPRRGENFVTRKISKAAARIHNGLQDKLYLGNLDSYRDWGYAPDYVRAMHMMLQCDSPSDYVVATGEKHSVREFVVEVFSSLGMNWEDYVDIKQDLFRPSEVNALLGDASKIKAELGWGAEVKFKKLCSIMLEHDLSEAKG